MELSIGQVAKRAGISARMLRHYDDLGIYRPSRVSDNGYRWYDQTTLPRLFRIVALRRAGISLPDIAQILAEHSNEAETLRQHLSDLRAEQRRLASLIAAIEEQVEQLDSAHIEDPDAFRATYRSEADALTGRLVTKHPALSAESYIEYSRSIEDMTVAETEYLVATSAVLMHRLAKMAADGVSPDSAEARDAVAEHYAMLTQTVPLSAEAYVKLSQAYRDDPLQREIVATFHELLPEWLAQAIERSAIRGSV